MWFQKISVPPPRSELEILKGSGGQRPRKFQRGGGLYDRVSFQRDSRGPLIHTDLSVDQDVQKSSLT